MHIKLNPAVHEFNNCFQGQVETIVEDFYQKNYLLTQMYRWTSALDVVDGKIQAAMEKDFLDAEELERVGLKQEIIKCKNSQEIIQKIKEELQNRVPVIAGIQISNCPWDPNYKKDFVMEHLIIINGMEEEKNTFICCDATYGKQDVLLPMEEFEAGCVKEYRKIIEFDKGKNLSGEERNLLLADRARELASGRDSHFQRIGRIGDFLIKNADTLKIGEKHLDNVLFSEAYMIIRDCARTMEMLAFIFKEQQGKKEYNLTRLFELCMKKWLKIRILYVRAATSKNPENYLIRMGRHLYEIKDMEERLADYIINNDVRVVQEFLQNHQNTQSRTSGLKQHGNMQMHIIDLSPFYNNKAFGLFSDNETAEFTDLGEYMIAPQDGFWFSPARGQMVHLDIANGMDNVICEDQRIPVHLKNVEELIVIGNTEFSTEKDNLVLELKEGKEERLRLELPEWYTEILNNEIPVMTQNVAVKEKGYVKMTSFSGKIFLKRFSVPNLDIESIRLPEEGRIHIFQIAAYLGQ